MKKILIALAAVAALGAAEGTLAQSSGTISMSDQEQLLVSQIQTDKRAVVLSALELTDAEVAAFTPIYDEYQAEMKKIFTRGSEVLNKYASNYDSMTDDAAEDILKEAFEVREDRNDILQDYAKRLGKKLPATKVLRWVQIENKLTRCSTGRWRRSSRSPSEEGDEIMRISTRSRARGDRARAPRRCWPGCASTPDGPLRLRQERGLRQVPHLRLRGPGRRDGDRVQVAGDADARRPRRPGEMEARGYTLADNPDLLVNFTGKLEDRTDVQSVPGPYYGPGWGYGGWYGAPYGGWNYSQQVTTRHYKVGTLVMDIVDREKRQVVFQAGIEKVVTKEMLDNREAGAQRRRHAAVRDLSVRRGTVGAGAPPDKK